MKISSNFPCFMKVEHLHVNFVMNLHVMIITPKDVEGEETLEAWNCSNICPTLPPHPPPPFRPTPPVINVGILIRALQGLASSQPS